MIALLALLFRYYHDLFLIVHKKYLYLCNLKTECPMKKLFIALLLLVGVGELSAQELTTTGEAASLAEAQIELDRAIANQRQAVDEIRSEERRITDAANERLDEAREEYNSQREYYRDLVADAKQRIRSAKEQMSRLKAEYRQEMTRAREEIAAARAATRAVEAEHNSIVAQARAEISRIRTEEGERGGRRR